MFLKTNKLVRGAALLAALCGFTSMPACGAKSGLNSGPPAPTEPECYRDEDCAGSGDACIPVICDLDIPPVKEGADPGGHCVELDPIDCDDNDPCTKDACDSFTGICSYELATYDLDGDGYRGPLLGKKAGTEGSCGDDCDDTNEAAHPGGIEVCDGVDNDCNDIIDDNATFVAQGLEPVRVSTTEFDYADPAGLAWSGESYVAEYTSGQGKRIFTAPLTAAGNKLPPGDTMLTELDADSYGGQLIWIGDRYGAVWQDRRFENYEIFFTLLNDKGEKAIPDVRLTSAFGFSLYPSIGWNGTEFIVAWQDERDEPGFYNVYAQRVDVNGVPIGDNVALTQDIQGFGNEAPWIAVGETSVGLTWGIGDTNYRWIQFQTFTPDLQPIMPEPISLTDGNTNARGQYVVWNQTNYVVAWHDESADPKAIYAAVVEENGAVSVTPKAISSPGTARSRFPNLRGYGNRVLAVYQDNRDGNDGYELYARMVDALLNPMTGEQRITFKSKDSTGPIAAFGPEGEVGVLFQDYDLQTTPAQQQVFFTRLGCVAGN
ncbi:MAG: putative metal-binding motif-containing protein [Polyangiaceae bacterium]|nr:putative metal-binding motif-containing protein [Polyangiaceae bacterium]